MSYGLQLDLSMDMGEESRVIKRYCNRIKELVKKTHFERIEIEQLTLIFQKIVSHDKSTRHAEFMTNEQFSYVVHNAFHITDAMIVDRIFSTICDATQRIPQISLEIWVQTMSLFLRGTLEEKIEHCFKVYDVLGTGILGKEIMYSFLHGAVIGEAEDAEDAVKDLIEIISRKLDVDRDAKISHEDYVQAVLQYPEMMECMGQCLPTRTTVDAFSKTVFSKSHS